MTTFHGQMNGRRPASRARVQPVQRPHRRPARGRRPRRAHPSRRRRPTRSTRCGCRARWRSRWRRKALADTGRYDAIVGLGAVMRGATYHFEVVANQSAAGLTRVAHDDGRGGDERHPHGRHHGPGTRACRQQGRQQGRRCRAGGVGDGERHPRCDDRLSAATGRTGQLSRVRQGAEPRRVWLENRCSTTDDSRHDFSTGLRPPQRAIERDLVGCRNRRRRVVGPGGQAVADRGRHGVRARRWPSARRGHPRRRQDAAGAVGGGHHRRFVLACAGHCRSAARRCRRVTRAQRRRLRSPLPAGTGVHQRGAVRRTEPHQRAHPVRTARGDGGGPRHRRRCHAPGAVAVHGHRHAEPGGDGRHLRARGRCHGPVHGRHQPRQRQRVGRAGGAHRPSRSQAVERHRAGRRPERSASRASWCAGCTWPMRWPSSPWPSCTPLVNTRGCASAPARAAVWR